MSASDDEKSRDEGGKDPAGGAAPGGTVLGRCYEICIGAQLDASWSEWFEGFEMHPCGRDWTILCGHVADQAASLAS